MSEMKNPKPARRFLKKPVYPGGDRALRQFISSQLVYPREALELGIEGTVILKYTINYKGEVIDTRVIGGLGHGCDEEAERVVRLLHFQTSKNYRLKTLFHRSINIHFRKREHEMIPAPPLPDYSFQYVVIPPESTTNSPSSKGYSYTITLPKT